MTARKSFIAIAIACGFVGLLAWALGWFTPATAPKTPSEVAATKEAGSEVRLTPKQIELAGIEFKLVTSASIDVLLSLGGEVTPNQDRLAEVVPQVPGIARVVRAVLGDRVFAGDVLAVIDSREFADAKSAYVSARERVQLAQAKFDRDSQLWQRRIIAEQEYLDTRSALSTARIEERSAEQKLKALGHSTADLKVLTSQTDASYTRYEVTAPIDGTVVAKQVTTGESVDPSKTIYRIADLSRVWIIASAYERDFGKIKIGQRAVITSGAYADKPFTGQTTWVSDTIDERTRTLKVRIEVENSDRLLKPGMYVNVGIAVDKKDGVPTVPTSALQRQKSETIVFIDKGDGRFERREVEVGVRSGDTMQITRGIQEGERVVANGGFILKSELEKSGFGEEH